MSVKILLADDEPSICEVVRLYLEQEVFTVYTAGDAALAFALVMARGLTRPVADISLAAARFAGGDYTSRTGATGDDELGRLGRTFNAMAEALAHAEENRRKFLADVTHELKTPVASIQAMAEALQDGLVKDTDQQLAMASLLAQDAGKPVQDVIKMKIINGSRSKE